MRAGVTGGLGLSVHVHVVTSVLKQLLYFVVYGR